MTTTLERTHTVPLLDVALELASIGMHVFPLKPEQKVPAVTNGLKAATTDRTMIREWWSRVPDLNIGIACGPSRLVVIDLDAGKPWPGEGEAPAGLTFGGDVLIALAEELEEVGDGSWYFDTATVATPSGGLHLYYVAPKAAEVRSSAGQLGPWIDVRARGGYVVSPWSRLPHGEYKPVNGFEWIVDATTDLTFDDEGHLNTDDASLRRVRFQPLRLPEWLLDRARVKPRADTPVDPWTLLNRALDRGNLGSGYFAAALRREIEELSTVKEGGRNHALNRAAYNLGTLIPHLDEQHVIHELTIAGQALGLPSDEVRVTIRSGVNAGRSNPRSVIA